MRRALERTFGLEAAGTTMRTEALAGATTFLTLSYILFVQPALFATCSALTFVARYVLL